jgi:DNA end-binding protein Ku
VTIPVNLFTATEDRDVHFHQLHKGCGARVQYQKSCPVHQKVLNRNEIERGFEVSKGHYVVVTDDDLQALPVPSKHTIEISAFVRIEEIDPLLYDKAYYVEPEDRGKKPMALLAKSITEKGMIGIGKIAIRNRETICALRLRDSSVILEILFWPDEIRKPVEAIGSHAEVDPKELKMANSLVDLLAGHFDPDAYKDEFRAGLMEMIDRKAEGRTIDAPEAEPTEVIDLMDALRKSVEAVKGGKRQAG